MRRISSRSIDLLRNLTATPPSAGALRPSFVCKHHAAFSTSTARKAEKSRTDAIRKRIWGTENPPGQVDPYSFENREQRVVVESKGEPAPAPLATSDGGVYEPAATWDGLEQVGGYGGWWKYNWDPEHPFNGFLPASLTFDRDQATVSLRRAIVEVLALQQAGVSLDQVKYAVPSIDLTRNIPIVAAADSSTGHALQFTGSETTLEQLVASLTPAVDETAVKTNPTESEEDVAADRSTVDPLKNSELSADKFDVNALAQAEAMEALITSWDPIWLRVSIAAPDVKFAVLKRTLQLTGIRVSDAAITSLNTAHALLGRLVQPPKPAKLAEALALDDNLAALPNVHISARRVTPIDRERALGRWKVIESELKARGLPVTRTQ